MKHGNALSLDYETFFFTAMDVKPNPTTTRCPPSPRGLAAHRKRPDWNGEDCCHSALVAIQKAQERPQTPRRLVYCLP